MEKKNKISRLLILLFPFFIFGVIGSGIANSKEIALSGMSDSSSRWGSGWFDLDTPIDFHNEDLLRFTLGGKGVKSVVL